MTRKRVVIAGAAGRDFHDFNVVFRDDAGVEVVAFTAAQIPRIEGRRYPPRLAGPYYPEGIPIVPEADLDALVRFEGVREVVFAYSDVSHAHVGHLGARAMAAGASFRLLGPHETMLRAPVPVVAVTAVRTGCGKSPTSRHLVARLRAAGRRVAVVRHPMPYGDLAAQEVQRFETLQDLARHRCTFEEREEYEAHVEQGAVVWAGVDYAEILAGASRECDVLLWDGGNNDFPFFRPDVWVCLVDPLRPGDETGYHPGEVNLRAADVVVVPKVDRADPEDVERVIAAVRAANPGASVLKAATEVTVDDPGAIRGRRVLCIEDGPTVTHGGMAYGAARVAAERYGAREVVDPRPHAQGSIRETFAAYPHLRDVLPAMGYWDEQIAELEATIHLADCDLVLVGTPLDLAARLRLDRPAVRVRYAYRAIDGERDVADAVLERLRG